MFGVMPHNRVDLILLAHGRRQHGVVSHRQLVDGGLTRRMIGHRLASGFLIGLEHGTYGIAGFAPTWQRQYKAAELSVDGAALFGLAAARVHDFDDAAVVRPEIVVSTGRQTRNRIATVHRSALPRTTVVSGIRVTTVAQTLFDVRNRVDLRRLERWTDGALLARKATVAELDERRHTYDSRRVAGIAAWRALVDDRLAAGWAPPESELEALLWDAYAAVPGRPAATRQAPAWWEEGDGRKDIVVDDWRLILEGDGRRWHARVRDFETDRWRDSVAVAHGYAVQRFTYLHLTRRAKEVSGLIAQAGIARAA
jgi:hypothetical protein